MILSNELLCNLSYLALALELTGFTLASISIYKTSLATVIDNKLGQIPPLGLFYGFLAFIVPYAVLMKSDADYGDYWVSWLILFVAITVLVFAILRLLVDAGKGSATAGAGLILAIGGISLEVIQILASNC